MTKKNKLQVKTVTDADYIKQAKDAWEEAREILEHTDSWVTEDGNKGCICSRKFQSLGKVWRLQAMLDATPEEVFDVLVTRVNDWPIWNPTIEECKTLHEINESMDISYNVGAAQVGGLVSSRDFVNLRHWKSLNDDIMIAAACHTTHKDMAPCKKHIRGENKPASYVFQKVPGQPDKCHFYCFLSTDLKGWLPQILIDQAMTGVLMDYLKHLQFYLTDLRKTKSANNSENKTKDTSVSVIESQMEDMKLSSSSAENSCEDSDSEYQDASDSEDFADADDIMFTAPVGPPLVSPVCS